MSTVVSSLWRTSTSSIQDHLTNWICFPVLKRPTAQHQRCLVTMYHGGGGIITCPSLLTAVLARHLMHVCECLCVCVMQAHTYRHTHSTQGEQAICSPHCYRGIGISSFLPDHFYPHCQRNNCSQPVSLPTSAWVAEKSKLVALGKQVNIKMLCMAANPPIFSNFIIEGINVSVINTKLSSFMS